MWLSILQETAFLKNRKGRAVLSVGSKIKAIRKKRGWTQQELADGIVTRGMLSRIERGSAFPSMQSLTALAEKLCVSPAFLLEEGNDLLPAELSRITKAIMEEYHDGNLEECLSIFQFSGLESDSALSGIYVSCEFSIALACFYRGDFESARNHLFLAEKVHPHLLLPLTDATLERIAFLRTMMDHIDDPDAIFAIMNDTPDFGFQPAVFFFTLKLLRDGKLHDARLIAEYGSLNACYLAYFEAQMQISEYKFIDAILNMKTLSGNAECPIFLSLLCYRSMENCCKLCEDYKGAYENHIRYTELLSRIKR